MTTHRLHRANQEPLSPSRQTAIRPTCRLLPHPKVDRCLDKVDLAYHPYQLHSSPANLQLRAGTPPTTLIPTDPAKSLSRPDWAKLSATPLCKAESANRLRNPLPTPQLDQAKSCPLSPGRSNGLRVDRHQVVLAPRLMMDHLYLRKTITPFDRFLMRARAATLVDSGQSLVVLGTSRLLLRLRLTIRFHRNIMRHRKCRMGNLRKHQLSQNQYLRGCMPLPRTTTTCRPRRPPSRS
jgi:hypothetical protein